MKRLIALVSGWGMATSALMAQDLTQEVPLQRPEEKRATQIQSKELYDLLAPVAREAGFSTLQVLVPVRTRRGVARRWVASATVVGDGTQALTKWSEIAMSQQDIWCVGGDGKTATATVLGVYPEDDVALLQLVGARFPAIEWGRGVSPGLGKFLIAAGAAGTPYNFGVVAVEERVARDSEKGFIGVTVDPDVEKGVRVASLDARGGAQEAGVKVNDIILKVGERVVNSAFELQNSLLPYGPGDEVTLSLQRGEKFVEATVELVPKPRLGGLPEGRLRQMRSMGTDISGGPKEFPVAIQSDLRLKPSECGSPVVDLDGNVIGLSISQVDRTRSFVLPASRILMILGKDPTPPGMAKSETENAMVESAPPRPRAVPMDPGAAGALMRSLEEVDEFLGRLKREMKNVENPAGVNGGR